jgi:hypothetical protein
MIKLVLLFCKEGSPGSFLDLIYQSIFYMKNQKISSCLIEQFLKFSG